MIIAYDDLLKELNDYAKKLEIDHKLMSINAIREWEIIENMARDA